MDLVWDLADSPEGFRQQSYYIRLGRGVSFRELNLPLVLVRRMEHYVRGAPDHYSLSQALRYGASGVALGAPLFWQDGPSRTLTRVAQLVST